MVQPLDVNRKSVAVRRRSPSNVLANLPPEQLVEFTSWLVKENVVYGIAQARLAERFGITISLETISQFYRRYCLPEVDQREEFIRRVVQQQFRERLAMPDAPTPPAKP